MFYSLICMKNDSMLFLQKNPVWLPFWFQQSSSAFIIFLKKIQESSIKIYQNDLLEKQVSKVVQPVKWMFLLVSIWKQYIQKNSELFDNIFSKFKGPYRLKKLF